MSKIITAILWLVITSLMLRYSLIFGFDHDTGIVGSSLLSFLILWLYAFFKTPTRGK